MTAAAAAVTSLVALVRYMETRTPKADTVQLEREQPRRVATTETLLPSSERAALAVRDERMIRPTSPTASVEPTPRVEAVRAPTVCAPGTLQLLVLENEQPVPGADVLVVPRKEGGIDRGCTDDLAPLLRATTDANGIATWLDLSTDLYDARIRHPAGAELACCVEIHESSGRERCVVRFGSARVRGTVLGDEGEPRRGSLVRLALAQASGETELLSTAHTDELGRFEFLRLPPGSALAIDGHPDASWLSPGRTVRVELSPTADREVLLGPAASGSRCEGRLVAPGGTTLHAEVALRWREIEHNWHATTRAHQDGSFELTLRPGTWSAYVAGRDGQVEIARAQVGADDVRIEAELPTGSISVRLVDADGSAVEGSIALRDATGARSEHPAPGGHAFVAGLAPGSWQIEGLVFDGAETRVQATIADHGAPLELTLELEPATR